MDKSDFFYDAGSDGGNDRGGNGEKV